MTHPNLKLGATSIFTGLALSLSAAAPAAADDHVVKVTPLGSHDGEFCGRDRALIFEDPNGTRISTMPGAPLLARTIRGWVTSM